MEAGGDEDDGEKSAFRCLDAARYAAAAVVIVLIAVVVVKAITVVLRPEDIIVLVLGSSVTTGTVQRSLSFQFTLRAGNPSGRAHLYYYNITAYVFPNANDSMATLPTPEDNCAVLFEPSDMSLPPMRYVDDHHHHQLRNDAFKSSPVPNDPDFIDPSFFDALYKKGGTVGGVTMRLDGQLVTEIRPGINTTAHSITLYCRDLVFGPEDKVADVSSQDTLCSTT